MSSKKKVTVKPVKKLKLVPDPRSDDEAVIPKGYGYQWYGGQYWRWSFRLPIPGARINRYLKIPKCSLGSADRSLVEERFPVSEDFIDECEALRKRALSKP